MNQGQFKDPLCYQCLGGAVVPPLSLTEEVVSSSPHLKKQRVFFTEFSESYSGKTPLS